MCVRNKVHYVVHIRKYVDQKDSAAMLAIQWSAGVTPEVNLRNLLHTGDETCKRGIHSGFETTGRYHQMSIVGISVAAQKGLVSSNFF